MAEEFDDFEMEDMSRKYPEYDNYDEQELNDEYDSLTLKRLDLFRSDIEPEDEQIVDVKERMNYIERIQENKVRPPSLIMMVRLSL